MVTVSKGPHRTIMVSIVQAIDAGIAIALLHTHGFKVVQTNQTDFCCDPKNTQVQFVILLQHMCRWGLNILMMVLACKKKSDTLCTPHFQLRATRKQFHFLPAQVRCAKPFCLGTHVVVIDANYQNH